MATMFQQVATTSLRFAGFMHEINDLICSSILQLLKTNLATVVITETLKTTADLSERWFLILW